MNSGKTKNPTIVKSEIIIEADANVINTSDTMDTSPTITKRKRNDLSLEKKLKIIAAVDKGDKNKSSVAREFQIPLTTLTTMLKNRSKIEESQNSLTPLNSRKRVRGAKHKVLDRELVEWFYNRRAANLPISGPLLREKAEQLSNYLGLVEFKCSNGWLQRLKERNQLTFDYRKKHKFTQIKNDLKFESEPEQQVYQIIDIEDVETVETPIIVESTASNLDEERFIDNHLPEFLETNNVSFSEIPNEIETNTQFEEPVENLQQISSNIVSPVDIISILPPINPLTCMLNERPANLPSKSDAIYAVSIIENVIKNTTIPVDDEMLAAVKKINELQKSD